MKFSRLWLILLLCACGPREIGEGTSYTPPAGQGNYNVAERMREPYIGSGNTQRMLYYYNRPDVMEKMRAWHISEFQRRAGIAPDPSDPAYRENPKMPSPFRE